MNENSFLISIVLLILYVRLSAGTSEETPGSRHARTEFLVAVGRWSGDCGDAQVGFVGEEPVHACDDRHTKLTVSVYAYNVNAAETVRRIRVESSLSLRALAHAAGLAASTVHRIEQGQLRPTTATLDRIAEAAGVRLVVEPRLDHAVSIVGLARAVRDDIAAGDQTWPVRRASELVHRFSHADADSRQRMLAAEPPEIGDPRWDAFVAALAEWLALQGRMPTPTWVYQPKRYLPAGWWVSPMPSMRAWQYAGSPASFQNHGVYIHRESLINV
jgi:transcriptional regulator with XRE-family HTH domain